MKTILDLFESGLSTEDEFKFFKEAVYTLQGIDEASLMTLMEQLPANKKDYLREVFNSQRIVVKNKSGKAATEARKIVKPKGRKIATNVNMNENE